MRRADHAHIHVDRLRSAEPLDLAAFERAHAFACVTGFMSPNFVEKKRAARRHLKFAALLGHAGERAALETE